MAKATVKRRKNATAPLSIGKRIKVQAQRKFALGAAIIPVQLPKETSSPVVVEPYKEPPREIKHSLNSNTKAKTEDFLTFLCFKGTSEITPADPISQIHREQYSSKNLVAVQQSRLHNNSPQPSTSIQGFIPFGVRKQASQFPARNTNTQLTIQALRSKYNREKQAKLCALAFKKSGDVCSQPKRVQTRSTKESKLSKSASKRKPKCVPSSFKVNRQPNSRTRPGRIEKPAVKAKIVQKSSEKNVSLRTRVVSVYATSRLNDSKSTSKGYEVKQSFKKQVGNVKQLPAQNVRVVSDEKTAGRVKILRKYLRR